MKVGIVVPYSWSYWGGVPEHAHHQALALRRLGVETRTLIGHDPPGRLTRLLHPRRGRHDRPPADVIPVGRSVIVPANGALPNIVLSPRSVGRIRRALERERFDVVHVHEPMTPAIGVATLALARCPIVATFHASGELRWLDAGKPFWGFLLDRIDHYLVVSERGREANVRKYAADYEVIPNGVELAPEPDPHRRENRVAFIGRHEPRKGLHVLLRAWPEVHAQTGARLRVMGADPLSVRLVLAKERLSEEGIDLLGVVSEEERTRELLAAKALASPSIHGESFGMVLTAAYACATPVVASDIPGYREVMTPESGIAVPPGDATALAEALVALLEDEPRRSRLGSGARRLAEERYSWDDIARRLVEIYERVSGRAPAPLAATG
jgi:phosphatidylinositol alpha-mannosyltransferase